MKISNRNWPALQLLADDTSDIDIEPRGIATMLGQSDDLLNYYRTIVENNKLIFRSNIYVLSDSFNKAYMQVQDQLINLSLEYTKEEPDMEYTGTYLINNRIIMIDFKTKGTKLIRREMVCITKNGGLEGFISQSLDRAWVDPHMLEGTSKEDSNKETVACMDVLARYCMTIELFKKYSDLQYKVLVPNSQAKFSTFNKVINQTKFNLTFINSTWFTEIVRDKEFGVKGHFRLQPYKKDGEWTRKLIYINAFKKNGYHRRAQKDIEHELHNN